MRIRHQISLLIFSVMTSTTLVMSQVPIEEQEVVASGSLDTSIFEFDYQYTIGEVATETKIVGDLAVTEGFRQPSGNLTPEVVFTAEATEVQCPDITNGSITVSPGGCIPPYTIEIAGDNGDTLYAEDVEEPYTFRDLDSGSYRVTVRGFTYCAMRDTVVVSMKNKTCDVGYYSGITPNGDGKNDFWVIDNIEINSPNEVQIFNRWGSKVWQGSNYDNFSVKFEGKNDNGRDLPSGTYFYTISVTGNADASRSGWIQLTR